MKKIFFSALMSVFVLTAGAQANIQIHYDFGKHLYNEDEHNRQDVTLTYEGFHADKIGSWYYFIDADFGKNGMIGAYTEISREFTFAKIKESATWAAHVEINAGLSRNAGIFQPAFLVGPAWNWHSSDFSKTLSLQIMYKQFTGQNFNVSGEENWGNNIKPYSSFQFTTVWGINICKDKLRFAGFIDFWRGENWWDGHGNLTILTEPQLWYNISKTCAVGTEWELSNNFIFNSINKTSPLSKNDKFYVNPTIAFKYQF